MADALAALPQLVVEGYRATTFDYDPPADADPSTRVGKEKWIAVFRASIPEFSRRAASDPRVADASALAMRSRSCEGGGGKRVRRRRARRRRGGGQESEHARPGDGRRTSTAVIAPSS